MKIWSVFASRYKLRACTYVGANPRVRGRIWIHGGGRIRIGDRVVLDASSAPIEFRPAKGGEIVIGDDVFIDGGASIEAVVRVSIGSRSRVGAFCKILDNHFHPLRGNRHENRPASKPVVVEEDVEIGPHAILLAGAHAGAKAVLRPGTVITRRVPPSVVIGGHPAAVLSKA